MRSCNGVISLTKSVGVVIHARAGSTRFPEKMLKLLGGRPILEWVILRAKRIHGADALVLATSRKERDDVIVDMASRNGINVFRGSEENVLERIVDAASQYDCDAIVRVCADNPFLDPDLIATLIDEFRRSDYDYMFNHRPGPGLSIADGFGAEIATVASLRLIQSQCSDARYREHITLAYWENTDKFKVGALSSTLDIADDTYRFDVDTESDLMFLNELVSLGSITLESSAVEIMNVAREQRVR
jgi:spore coat polysaccharide biosynthesis protein SpsF